MRRRAPASCHPDRALHARGLCGPCYRALARGERRMFNRVGICSLGQGLPRAIAGVEQRVVVAGQVPLRCPKCGNAHLVTAGRYVSCPGYLAGCGWDAFMVANR